jgi:N-acyl-D-amino-acid deacylase
MGAGSHRSAASAAPSFDVILTGGLVVRAGERSEPTRADVGIAAGRIVEVGDLKGRSAVEEIDCVGKHIFPGFIDAHAHGEGSIFRRDVQLAMLRQGITTVVLGQDGVSLAPDSAVYGESYFGTLNGTHPNFRGGGVADLLATYHRSVPVNVAYLVPMGAVRHRVMGYSSSAATSNDVRAMRSLLLSGLDEGAVGASTGLDYVPGRFATTQELASVLEPLGDAQAVYVTHMRGGYEENSQEGLAEVQSIARASGIAVHISHLHARVELLQGLLADFRDRGIDLTFDSYPYRRGFSLLAMPIVPEQFLANGPDAVLRDRGVRRRFLNEWFPRVMADTDNRFLDTRLAHVPAEAYVHLEGSTLADASIRSQVDPAELVFDVLVATGMRATAVFAAPGTTSRRDYVELMRHEGHMVGSDGIFVGTSPHPRAWGAFARVLARHTGDDRTFSVGEAADHLSRRAARRFGLSGRGHVGEGAVADIAVVDMSRVTDNATYDVPRALATGVDTVVVNGRVVLRAGELTGETPGEAISRTDEVRQTLFEPTGGPS